MYPGVRSARPQATWRCAYIVWAPPESPPTRKPSMLAGYDTPCTTTFPAPIFESNASKKGGPTSTPTFPGSVVPRANMTVTAPQDPERPFWVVLMPRRKARTCSAAISRSEISVMRPLNGKRRAISARKVLMSREYMGAATTSETKGRRSSKENCFIFVYLRTTRYQYQSIE